MIRKATLFVAYLCIFLSSSTGSQGKNNTLYIGGFFPLEDVSGNWVSGPGILLACQMAVDLINNSTSLLPDHRLVLLANDTKGSLPVAQKHLFDYVFHPPTKIMLIGAGYSSVTEPLAQTSALWNLIQVSYASTSPILSDRSKYPYFFRTIESELAFNEPRIALLKYYNWTSVATLHQAENIFSETMSDLRVKLVANNFTILSSDSFRSDPKVQISNLKSVDARIIIASFYEDTGRKVMCEAYHQKLYGKKYVWILLGWLEPGWWNHNVTVKSGHCTKMDMYQALKGSLATDLPYVRRDGRRAVSGQNTAEFITSYINLATKPNQQDLYAPYAYDAMYAVALTLNQSQEELRKVNKTLTDFTYNDAQMAHIFRTNMQHLRFEGISGSVSFNTEGTRIGNIVIQQMQHVENVTKKVVIGSHSGEYNTIEINDSLVKWEGNKAPVSAVRTVTIIVSLDLGLVISMFILATLGILLAIAFLAFNVVFRKERFIKMSSPRMNNLIVIGCIVMYLSVFMFGLDSRWVPSQNFGAVCASRVWCPVIGFTLMFGAIFTKTYRVHKIFTSGGKNKVVMKDSYLIGIVMAFLFMDIAILSAWQIIDPMILFRRNLTSEMVFSADTTTIPQIWLCEGNYKVSWLIALFALKGTVIFIAVFFAWETRKVNVPALNDSYYIGMSVYNVVILAAVGVPVIVILSNNLNPAFALTAGFIIFGNTIILCLVFVPKIWEFRNNPDRNSCHLKRSGESTFSITKVAPSASPSEAETS